MAKLQHPVPIFFVLACAAGQLAGVPPVSPAAPADAGQVQRPFLEQELTRIKALQWEAELRAHPSSEAVGQQLSHLRGQLEVLQADAERLRANNGVLREQLGRSAEEAQHSVAAAPRRTAPPPLRPPAVTAPRRGTSLVAVRQGEQFPAVQLWQVLTIFGCCALVFAAFHSYKVTAMAKSGRSVPAVGAEGADWRERLSLSCQDLSKHPGLGHALRVAGITGYDLEVRELHVGGLAAGSRLYLKVQDGRRREQCSSVAWQCDGAFVRFHETFPLHVRSSDDKIVFLVMDAGRSSTVARLALPAKELIRLARRRNQQFFRSELRLNARSSSDLPGGLGHGEQAPYIAMRLCEVTPASSSTPLLGLKA